MSKKTKKEDDYEYKVIADEEKNIDVIAVKDEKKVPIEDSYCSKCGAIIAHEKYPDKYKCILCGKVTEV